MSAGIGNSIETDLVGEHVEVIEVEHGAPKPSLRVRVRGLVRAVLLGYQQWCPTLWIELRCADDIVATSSFIDWGYPNGLQIGDVIQIGTAGENGYGAYTVIRIVKAPA